jgi:hypothetical protein
MMTRTTIHRCAQPECPARGTAFSVTARVTDHDAADKPMRCPVCGTPGDFIRNETTIMRLLRVFGGLIICVLSMEVATLAGVPRGPAFTYGLICFAISTLLLGICDWLKHARLPDSPGLGR